MWASTAVGEAAQQAGPGRPARPPARRRWAAAARAIAASVSSADAEVTAATRSSVAGFSTVNVDIAAVPLAIRRQRRSGAGHSRSKPRRSSQSVTAASKAASSTRA